MSKGLPFSNISLQTIPESIPVGSDPASESLVIQGTDQNLIQYTFHRHSAPKNKIYYRCSDKRCPVRLHFDIELKTFSIKNHHLAPKIHKIPGIQKATMASDLIANSNLVIRGPLALDRNLEIELSAAVDNLVRPNGALTNNISGKSEDKLFIVQFLLNSSKNYSDFRKSVLNKCLASKVNCYKGLKKFTNQKCEKIDKIRVEIETVTHFMSKVLILINHYFGRGVEVLFYS